VRIPSEFFNGITITVPVDECNRDFSPLVRGLLALPHVQFWETENSWRLDSSHRRGHRGDIPCLVDATDVRTVNALKPPPAWFMSVTEIFRQPTTARPRIPSCQKAWRQPTERHDGSWRSPIFVRHRKDAARDRFFGSGVWEMGTWRELALLTA
jgi:hypothetical protein